MLQLHTAVQAGPRGGVMEDVQRVLSPDALATCMHRSLPSPDCAQCVRARVLERELVLHAADGLWRINIDDSQIYIRQTVSEQPSKAFPQAKQPGGESEKEENEQEQKLFFSSSSSSPPPPPSCSCSPSPRSRAHAFNLRDNSSRRYEERSDSTRF